MAGHELLASYGTSKLENEQWQVQVVLQDTIPPLLFLLSRYLPVARTVMNCSLLTLRFLCFDLGVPTFVTRDILL